MEGFCWKTELYKNCARTHPTEIVREIETRPNAPIRPASAQWYSGPMARADRQQVLQIHGALLEYSIMNYPPPLLTAVRW